MIIEVKSNKIVSHWKVELVEEELVEDAKILIYLIQLYKYKYVIIIW